MLKKLIIVPFAIFVLCISVITGYAETAMDISDTIMVEGQRLVKDKDYTLTYYGNTDVGEAKIVVEFIGNYAGTKECRFNIIPQARKTSGGGGGEGLSRSIIPLLTPAPSQSPIPETEPMQMSIPTPSMIPEMHNAYISGYGDNTFKPANPITRAETAAMLSRVINADAPESEIYFTDLQEYAWYIPYINKMTACGVIHGYEDGTFRPDSYITRAEFVTMLMQNREISEYFECPFSDVTSDLWSAKYISSAYMEGLVDGYEDGSFRTDSYITRAEAVAIVNRMTGRNADRNYVNNHMAELNPFTDMKDRIYWAFYDVIEAANGHSVVNGNDGEKWVK